MLVFLDHQRKCLHIHILINHYSLKCVTDKTEHIKRQQIVKHGTSHFKTPTSGLNSLTDSLKEETHMIIRFIQIALYIASSLLVYMYNIYPCGYH